jgi:hypothetical protein
MAMSGAYALIVVCTLTVLACATSQHLARDLALISAVILLGFVAEGFIRLWYDV